MFCQRCGTEVPVNTDYCTKCGLGHGTTTPMPAVPTVVTPEKKSELEIVREALGDVYDVQELIGRGGMATVFRAQEKDLGRDVALKVLPFSHEHDTNFVQRFAQEARTAARLEHANIIPIYRVGRSGNVIYLAMRYLSGPTLAELIEQVAPMEPKDIRRILIESARALGHAHEHQVVHRDVKPDNIMFKESGDVVVCDFGIAKAASETSLTGTGVTVGTPLYMSPEQVKAQTLDGRSDLYSLGVVGYQCLTGSVPFDGEDSFAIGFKHLHEEPPVPQLKTAEHESLFRIIRKMLAKDPAERFPDADSLITALSSDPADGVPVLTLSSTVTDQIEQAPKRPKPSPAEGRTTTVSTTPITPIPARPSLVDSRASFRRPKKRRSGVLVGMLLVTMLGGVGGGGYYYVDTAGGLRPAVARFPQLASILRQVSDAIRPSGANTAVATPAVPVATASLSGPAGAVDSVAPNAALPDTLQAVKNLETEAPRPGRLVIANLPSDATLWINDRFVTGLRHDLEEGSYRLRIVAPGFDPYATTVTVSAGDTLVHRVTLEQMAQCEQLYEAGYNLREACFEVSPRLRPGTSSAVTLRKALARTPTRPVILGIQVLPDGTAGTVIVRDPSDVAEFSIQAVAYAKSLAYTAATKQGRTVTGWVELPFYAPRPR